MKYWVSVGLLLVSTLAYPDTRVQVEGHGRTEKEAKQDACNTAIKQEVGEVIVSDQEVKGDRLTKDFIGSYSSGYCKYSEMLEIRHESDRVVVKMNVAVASSKIAQRMMSRGEHTNIVNGDHAMVSLESELERRANGDALINQVLSSYPENAYIINSGQTEFKVSNLRQAYVEVPYDITMSLFWIEALNDALRLVAFDSNKCNTLTMAVAQGINRANTRLGKDICGSDPAIRVAKSKWSSEGYYFPDIETLHMINNELRTEGQQHIGLRVDLLDAGGNLIDSRCARINNERFIRYERPVGTYNLRDRYINSRPNIFGQENVYGTLRVGIRTAQQLEDLVKIKLTVQRTCT
jgi:hypothetical protein